MTTGPGLLSSIGDNLRSIREQRGLTLELAAESAGLSKSHLSRLESSERQPSVAALLALSSAFGVPVGQLFGEHHSGPLLATYDSDEPRRESNGLVIAPCSGFTGSSMLDALRVTVRPERPDPLPTRHPGEEWLYVLDGCLSLEYDGESHLVHAGSAVHFNAEVPHRLSAKDVVTEILLVAAKPARNIHTLH